MRHFASGRFWASFEALPVAVQRLARRCYVLLKRDPSHPSLQFKAVAAGRFRSVRVGLHYRALGLPVDTGILWFWIGSHADYDRLIA